MPANDGSNGTAANGHATEHFPPNPMTAACSKWTEACPKNNHVYGKKMLGCSDGMILPRSQSVPTKVSLPLQNMIEICEKSVRT